MSGRRCFVVDAPETEHVSPLDVLQDRSFGTWLCIRFKQDPTTDESDIQHEVDMAIGWPFVGSILDALSILSNGPLEWGAAEAAEIFKHAHVFAAEKAAKALAKERERSKRARKPRKKR